MGEGHAAVTSSPKGSLGGVREGSPSGRWETRKDVTAAQLARDDGGLARGRGDSQGEVAVLDAVWR